MPNPNGRVFTEGELQFASWWVRNRLALRKYGFVTLIVFTSLVWAYVIWGLVDAYAISYPRESRITRQMAINLQLLTDLESDRPQPVALSEVEIYSNTDGRVDMAVEIGNPNAQWWAEFNYNFNLSGEETPKRTGYVLPSGKQVLTELGYRQQARGGRSATLVIDNVRWHRVDPKMVGESYPDFYANRMNLATENIKYDTDLIIGSKRVGQTTFDLVNRGAYGFWNVDFVVRLYRGTSPAAITLYKATNLSPGERRQVQLVWPDPPGSVSKTEIISQVNLLDKNAYLKTEYFK